MREEVWSRFIRLVDSSYFYVAPEMCILWIQSLSSISTDGDRFVSIHFLAPQGRYW